jgi:hypothetical protein
VSATLTYPGLIKPARRSLRGRARSPFVAWRAGGLSLVGRGRPFRHGCLRPHPGLGRATWITSPHWGVGRAGLCTVHDGGNTVGLALEGTNSATNLLKRQYPITLEAVVEPFGNQSLHRTIFTNDDWGGSTYRGRVLQFTTDNRFQINLGDGTGNGAADRRTFHVGSALTLSKVYHVIATIRSATTGSFWINGLSTSYTTSGTGGTTISYTGTPQRSARAAGSRPMARASGAGSTSSRCTIGCSLPPR